MGCGSSRVNPDGNNEAVTPRPMPAERAQKPRAANGHIGNGNTKKKTIEDSNANRSDVATNNPVPKSIVFNVDLDGKETDSLVLKHPPLKLKKLAPLNLPTLTAEELVEKQKLADEKREKVCLYTSGISIFK
ncbi:hypothetical protein FSP39_012621 [Pinctada imbricata]|uniref:Uncharacterized protein n=1 Tax=Pinctada imbricata TaxID=66713 RepID=A0AA89BSZ7_PINIB|nr:hypothetical protein FSP39_012621 [Pinctada imbricata]